ncbi:MAG: hypothetical protein WEB04_04900 [Dehalococcoidia bacterium]
MAQSRSFLVPPGLLVSVRTGRAPRLFSHCLGDATNATAEPALVLDLAPRNDPSASPRDVTLRGVYKVLPWTCRIAPRAEGSWAIAFRSPVFREYLALHIALLPTLRRLLLDRAVGMAIGAAFELDGATTMVAGTTGRGKTSIVLGALERGATLIGDEYIGLHDDGDVTPVIRSLALRRATLALAPRAYERLGAQRRGALRVAEILTFVTRGFLQPLVHVPPQDILDRAPAPSGRLSRLFLIETGDAARRHEIDRAFALEQLATMQALHDVAYGDLGALLGGAPYPERWREIVARALEGVACYRLVLPRGDVPAEALDLVLEAA